MSARLAYGTCAEMRQRKAKRRLLDEYDAAHERARFRNTAAKTCYAGGGV